MQYLQDPLVVKIEARSEGLVTLLENGNVQLGEEAFVKQ